MRIKALVIFTAILLFAGLASADIIINEIMQNPSAVYDSDGEWFELYNSGATDVDIDGWIIKDNDTDSTMIDNGGSLVIAAGGYLVLGINGDYATNGGVNVDYVYTGITLSNSSDEIVLLDDVGTEIDRVEYDNGATFPDPSGSSMYLLDPSLDNNVGENWDTSTQPWPGSAGDDGTPGYSNIIARPTVLGNGDFEAWIDASSPEEWMLNADHFTIVNQELTIIHGGLYSAMVSWSATGAQIMFQDVYDVTIGMDYYFGAWVYDNDSAGYVELRVAYQDANGDDITAYTGGATADLDGWQFLSVSGDVPDGTDRAEVSVRFVDDAGWDGDAVAYVDDAFFGKYLSNEYIQTNSDSLLGSTVVTTGIVTQPNGTVSLSHTDVYFQDDTGYGLMLYDPDILTGDGMDRGDEVLVVGDVADYYGVTELVNFAWLQLSEGNDMPDAMVFTTGDFINAQDWEGVWSEITGILQNDPDVGSYNLYLDDGTGEATVRINADANLDLSAYAMGDELTVRGVIDLYFGGTQCTPSLQEDIGPLNPPAALSLDIWPIDPPIIIPAGGGSFQFDALVTNNTPDPIQFRAWTTAILPNGNELQNPIWIGGPFWITGYGTVGPQNPMTVDVPGFAPAGTYTFIANVGNYPNLIVATDSFEFEKSAAFTGENGYANWDMSSGDWTAEGESAAADLLPGEYAINEVYPNPFNPTTTVSIALPAASDLTVSVFNVMGRQVAEIANGRYTEGYHNFTFDARSLSSGIYFIQAVVPGKMSEIRKVMLVR